MFIFFGFKNWCRLVKAKDKKFFDLFIAKENAAGSC